MKRFFSVLLLLLAVLAMAFVATPLAALQAWFGPGPGQIILIAINNEVYLKAGIGGFFLLTSFIYLFVSMYEVKAYGSANRLTLYTAIVPPLLYAFSAFAVTLPIRLFAFYSANLLDKVNSLIIPLVLVNLLAFGHFLVRRFEKGKRGLRVFLYFFAVELMLGAAYFAYVTVEGATNTLDPRNYLFIAPAYLVFYFVHVIILAVRKKKEPAGPSMEEEVKEIKAHAKEIEAVKEADKHPEHKLTKAEEKAFAKALKGVAVREIDGKKTLIVSREQTIISSEKDVDPTNLLYEEVAVDPEFNKTANMDKQISTIDYYIEKPKLFKPLDPQFDELVQYIRDLPSTVTKIADERITFYIDRKPFLVLMNFGNYYRMVFRSDLEKGIRLIIKYPTISKNKASKEDLWFKANNYGDLPREVVYDICKTAYDNVNL